MHMLSLQLVTNLISIAVMKLFPPAFALIYCNMRTETAVKR